MRKIIIAILSCTCLLLVTYGPVWAKGQSSPKKAIKEYYDAWYSMDAQKAYESLTQQDKDMLTLEQFTHQYGFNSFEEKLIRSKSSYKIGSIKEKGDKPTAEIKFSVPDSNALMERAFNIMASFKSPGMTEAQMEEAMLKQIKKEKIATLEMTTEIKLLKDKEGWHVFHDWATEQKVAGLLNTGRAASRNNDPVKAYAAYEEALKLDPNSKEVREGFAKAESGVKKFAEKQAYIKDKIEILDFEAQKYEYNDLFAGKLMLPGVKFKLKNNGDKTLRTIQVKITFYDANGAVLTEFKEEPIVAFSFTSPLAPGEVWAERDNPPHRPWDDTSAWRDQWREGDAKVEVIDVTFKD